jgi:transcriptional regulator with XRE-family HTH domain
VSNIVSAVGRRVRQLRIRAGMTQERLAERAEISVSFLSMIERGERSPHLETLERLALGLEVPVEELFRLDPVERQEATGDASDGAPTEGIALREGLGADAEADKPTVAGSRRGN